MADYRYFILNPLKEDYALVAEHKTKTVPLSAPGEKLHPHRETIYRGTGLDGVYEAISKHSGVEIIEIRKETLMDCVEEMRRR